LGQAQEEMQLAARQLQRGGQAEDQQDEILDRLDEAFREIQQARKQAEEELDREKLGRVADTLKRFRERQEPFNAEAARIQEEAQKRGEWTRTLRKSSLDSLAQNQQQLGKEVSTTVEKELAQTPVIARIVGKSAEAMRKAGDRLAAMVENPPEV